MGPVNLVVLCKETVCKLAWGENGGESGGTRAEACEEVERGGREKRAGAEDEGNEEWMRGVDARAKEAGEQRALIVVKHG